MNWIKIICLITGLLVVTKISYSDSITCEGFATPELVYLAYVDAIIKDDWKSAYSYVEPRKRAKLYKEFVFGLIVASSFDEELSEGIIPIFRENGFTINQKNQYIDLDADLMNVNNWPKLMGQIAAFMRTHGGYKFDFASRDNILVDVKIEVILHLESLNCMVARKPNLLCLLKLEVAGV